jgi:hypothetical protein
MMTRACVAHRDADALGGLRDTRGALRRKALAQVEALRGRLDVLIVDYDLGLGMTGTELAEEFARLLGHAVPTVMLTGDPANAEVPWLADAPVWVARKPLLPTRCSPRCRRWSLSGARSRRRAR